MRTRTPKSLLLFPLVAVLAAGLVRQPAASADPGPSQLPKPKQVTGVRVTPAHAAALATENANLRKLAAVPVKASWPAAGRRAVDPATGVADRGVTLRRKAGAAAAVGLTVHDRAATGRADVDGLLVSLDSAASQSLAVKVDYSSFAQAVGGDWASRLRLVRLPACALTTPEVAACRSSTPVPATNDVAKQTLSAATVAVSGGAATVLAAEAGPSGDNGDYTATDLNAASTWQVSNQTGDFSWSYPLRLPPALGGPAPTLSLDYSSQSVDGLTGATNNQGGWVGDGWSMWSGFIERKYASCADDNPEKKTNDQCWFSDNATLSMNGHAGELVRDGDVWRLKKDDGTTVRKLTDRKVGNGDNDNEYWQVVTADGTQYFFGYHKLPGWTDNKPVTNSVWTAPVYGNDKNEPCHADEGLEESRCDQAWRWNLDYVLDPHGNSMAYFYQREEGAYGRDTNPDKRTTYDRGGYLQRVEYGMRKDAEYDQAAPLRVVFTTKERCLSNCWEGEAWKSDPVKSSWRDTPWDQYCKESPCEKQPAPTFWSARRLTEVTAQIRSGATAYTDVESWKLRQEFLSAGTGEGVPMWLAGLTRTGELARAGGVATSDPEIVFSPGAEPLENRVDAENDQRTDLKRWRIKSILNESGGKTLISYSDRDCTRSSLPQPKTNTTRCFPAYYSFPGSGDPAIDWFHKYVVTRVDLDDVVTDQPDQTTFYDYLDKPAWHYTEDELTKKKYRTWGEWRGYSSVRVRQGKPGGEQTATEYTYLRGMDGDYLSKTEKREVSVEGRWGGPIKDREALQGFVREQTTLNGPDGAEVESTVNDPWLRGPTATRTRDDVTTNAWMTQTATTRTRIALAAGGYRTTKTTKAFNDDGLVRLEDDFGDANADGDETCVRTTYARNPGIGLVDRVAQTEKVAGTCAEPGAVLTRTRKFYDKYDGPDSLGRAPTEGDVVRTEELERFSGTTPVYSVTSRTYDDNGRVRTETDARDYTTRTDYTFANGGLLTGTTVTNPLGHQVITTREPAWDLATHIQDANGLATDLHYDGLGRLTGVWLPGRDEGSDTPSLQFEYKTRNSGGPTAVTTRTLLPTGSGYRTSIALYDGFLRQRQAQIQATGGGRTLTDTRYDEAGRVSWESEAYYDDTNAAPDTTLGVPTGQIPAITEHLYDGAGREKAKIFKALGAEKWRTTTTYGGDRTTEVPPAGGIATTEITDAHGNITALRQYKDPAQAGSDDARTFDLTSYRYTLLDQQKTVIDPLRNTWNFEFDARGRKVKEVDPDKGTTTSTFDLAGNLATETGQVGTGTATIAWTYDAINRKTTMRDGSATGPLRAEWAYDKTAMNEAGTKLAKGKPSGSTRYVKNPADPTKTLAYVSRTDRYDELTRPTTTSVVVPPTDTTLCAAGPAGTGCTYTTTSTYKPNGQPATATMPAAGGLAEEKLTYGYTDVGEAGTLYSAAQVYVDSVTYDKIGQLTQRVLGDSSVKKHLAITNTYDEPTRRLTASNVVPMDKPEAVDFGYEYDAAGNVTKVSDTPQNQAADVQCYRYDYLRRLTKAWTPAADSCAADPSYAGLGGPAQYWREYAFDATGNRTEEVVKASTGDTTYTYTTPPSGPTAVRPHAVTGVTATGAKPSTRAYAYDKGGNTKTRPAPAGGSQTLTWDAEGSVESIAEAAGTTRFVYDADGNRLVRTDANGNRTLYAGTTEIRFDKAANTKKATRYYTHAGMTIAVRGAGKLNWVVGDHHGTAELTVDAATLTPAKRRTLPYGELRGPAPAAWPSVFDKGMVGGTVDPVGLTHLGAREYDPFLGRFTSVDPKVDTGDPQTLHGYLYSNNNPATFSDPTGESWGTFWKVAAIVAVVAVVVTVAIVAGPALVAAAPAITAVLEAGATTAAMTGSATATAAAVG
ncbi:RHS repeat-associated core domain-containing protein, partial [Actinoplanes sp. NPDC051633]|uniref:RHS repeat-associated core domain-containing protein n=1 Tax=Actinoplanes sp. NPDC051633 TaxID=3155670 RepID=UPI0034358C06